MAKIKIDAERCKGCGLCILYCPKGYITLSEKLNKRGAKSAKFRKDSKCSGCSFCALICPDAAIEIYK